MNESAAVKIDNLNTLALCAKEIGLFIDITVDEDGFYIIGDKMFTDYKSALKYIVNFNK